MYAHNIPVSAPPLVHVLPYAETPHKSLWILFLWKGKVPSSYYSPTNHIAARLGMLSPTQGQTRQSILGEWIEKKSGKLATDSGTAPACVIGNQAALLLQGG